MSIGKLFPGGLGSLPLGDGPMFLRLYTGAACQELQQLVEEMRYKPGWAFWLTDGPTMAAGSVRRDLPEPAVRSSGGTAMLISPVFFHVEVYTLNSGNPSDRILVTHTFLVPENPGVPWERWLLDRVLDVERHEAMEFLRIGARRPFYPEHGPGARSYDIPASPRRLPHTRVC